MKSYFVSLILVLSLSSCITHSMYSERVPGILNGYEDERLGKDTYQVRYGETWADPVSSLEKMTLYRAAEIARAAGYPYYEVLKASSEVNQYTWTTPETTTITGTANTIGNTTYVNATSTTTGGTSPGLSGTWYYLDIRLIHHPDDARTGHFVDVHQIMSDLEYFINKRRY